MGGLFQAFKYSLDLFFLAHFSWCHPLYLNRWNMLPEVWLSEREHCCDNPLILPAPPPPPPPPIKIFFGYLPIILSVCQFEMSERIRLNSALMVDCLRVFLAALSKVFRKASLSLMKEQFSRLAKSAASNIFWYFVCFRVHG